MVVAADQLKDMAILLACELVCFHAALVHNPILHDEWALAETLLHALEEHGPAPLVQKVTEALRVGLVALIKKHDDVFWERKK